MRTDSVEIEQNTASYYLRIETAFHRLMRRMETDLDSPLITTLTADPGIQEVLSIDPAISNHYREDLFNELGRARRRKPPMIRKRKAGEGR